MTVVVTGAGGFVGRRVVAALVRAGRPVVAVVRTDVPAALTAMAGVRVVTAELGRPLALDCRPVAVIHAAARSGPAGTPAERFVHDNAVATAHVARFAAEAGAAAFVYLSSLSIYGQVSTPVVDEATPRCNPCPYGMTKYLGERMLQELAERLPSVSLRLPGIVGAGATGPWLARMAAAALAGQALTITNAAALFNNAIHVADLADFIGALVDRRWQGAQAITIGASHPLTVKTLIETLVAAARSSSSVIDAGPRGTPFVISCARAEADFGYRPAPMAAIIDRYVEELRAEAGDQDCASAGT